MNYLIKPALTMLITAVIAVSALTWVSSVTAEPIRLQAIETQNSTMREVLPEATSFVPIETDLPENINAVFEALNGDKVIGYAVEVWNHGYDGPITLMLGISPETESITGMRVLSHTETPGLGDAIQKEFFYSKFDGMEVTTPITVIKGGGAVGENNEIDAITASTISSRAVAGAVNFALEWYNGGSGR